MFSKENRDWSVDLLRVFSCFMVCIVHAAGRTLPGYYDSVVLGSTDWLFVTLYRGIFASGTVLFVMISGIFFLSPERNVTAKKVWTKNVPKMAAAYIGWSFLYAFYEIRPPSLNEIMSGTFIRQWLEQPDHMWYIPMIISLYIIVPLLRYITASQDEKLFRYIVIIFIAGIAIHTVFDFPELPAMQKWTQNYIYPALWATPYSIVCQYMFWMLFGYIAYTYRPRKQVRLVLYGLGLLSVVLFEIINYVNFTETGAASASNLVQKFNLLMFFKNVSIFYIFICGFEDITFSDRAKKWIAKMSSATLVIYLAHWLIHSILFDHGFLYTGKICLPVTAAAWVYAIISFVVGLVLAELIHLVPWKKAWIKVRGL